MGESASLASYFDSAAVNFTRMNGSYVPNFRAKAPVAATPFWSRRTQPASFVDQIIQLSGLWADYSIPFTATDPANPPTPWPSPSPPPASRPSARRCQPHSRYRLFHQHHGVSRSGSQYPAQSSSRPAPLLGRSAGRFARQPSRPSSARQRSGYSSFSTQRDDIGYGLHEFLQLCQLVGADPWIVVPTVFSPAEASQLIDYLAGSAQTVYGAKRAALGQATPWISVFSKIHLEFGNEAWNPTFKGGSIEYPQPYGNRAQTIFGAMRSTASDSLSSFDLALGGQAVASGRNQDIQDNCNNNDSFGVAPYHMLQVDSYADNESMFGPLLRNPR